MASSSRSGGGAFDAIIESASEFVASTSGMKLPPFDVFINHYGQDVKLTLATSIYKSLNATGLKVFLDKPELKYGDLLPKALEEAMESASIYIAIFSEHYAQSPWCLAELEYMVKSCKTIIPIFYNVDPSDLRWAIGGKRKYAAAFLEHEEKARYAPDVLKRWKEALQQVSLCIGGIINNIGDEQKVVKEVVNRVMKEMNKVPLEVAKHPVGLDEVVQDFNTFTLQSVGSTKIVVGIWGMGGSGKTTLAKEIFNQRHSAMHWSSFLSDIRDAQTKGLLLDKQKTLLKDLDAKDECLDNLDKGKQILKNRLSRSVSVLIVLDDVDHIDQLDALLPPKESLDSLGSQSLIIVTTRNANVLQQWGISAIYPMKALNATHAKQLFCWHAFLLKSPPSEFEDFVEKFLKACHGLPLSLKVLGGQLCGKSDNDYWQDTLNKFSQIPHTDIKNRLKVSYDALEKEEKEMFLDAACLFIGERKSAAIAAWDAEFYGTLVGWDSLLSKCLVEEDEYGLIRMHDHLRDLGRDIANGQSPHRLWSPEQVIKIPPQQEAIQVRGIARAVGNNCFQRQGKIIIKTTNEEELSLAPSSLGLKFFVGNGESLSQELSDVSKELIWVQCNKFEHKNLPSWLSLKKLRILAISDSRSLEHLWAEDADALLQLRELIILGCNSLAGFPRSIGQLKNLKYIVIRNYNSGSCAALRDLPQEFCNLQSLEHLEMRSCRNLSSLPSNFGKLTKLRRLNLESCTKLEALPDSFKKLTLLEYLSLACCEGLTIKSELNVLENMTKLRYLNFQGCEKLKDLRLPELVYLRDLHLIGTGLKELAANIFHLTKLTELEIGSEFLITLPTSVGNLSPLTTLTIVGCKKLKSLPDSLEHLTLLRDLTMKNTGVKCLPKSLIHLQSLIIKYTPVSELSFRSWCMLKIMVLSETKVSKISIGGDSCPALETLDLIHNDDLRELETLPEKLKTLNVEYCKMLKDIRGVRGLKELKRLQICGCKELDELPCFAELVSLENFILNGSSMVKKIAGLQKLRSLRELSIEIDELPSFAEYTSLKKLVLKNCNKLEKIEGLENVKSLEKIEISHCSELVALPEITSLKELQLENCHRLGKIEGLKNMTSLDELQVCNCSELKALPEITSLKILQSEKWHKKIEGLGNMRSLEALNISECLGLETLPEMTSLKRLELNKCSSLKKIEGLGNMRSLQKLIISDCFELESLPCLSEITSLKSFELNKCSSLKKIEGLGNMRSLQKLIISDCFELESLPSLSEITSLKVLELEKCHKKIEGLENMRSLEALNISECLGLETLPEMTSLKILKLNKCSSLKTIEGLGNMRSLQKLIISDCFELESLPCLSEITSLEVLQLENCYKLEKIEGLEGLRLLLNLKVHTRWNAPCIVSLEHSERLDSLDVVANNISAVEPFVSNIQKWPREVMVCTRPECGVGLLKSFFQNLPNVSVLDYTKDHSFLYDKVLRLFAPVRTANAKTILRCFIIDCDCPDSRISITLDSKVSKFSTKFNAELGEGKWVWMGVRTQYQHYGHDWIFNDDISARDSKGERVEVRVEAAWLVMGEEGSIVEAFRQHFQRGPRNEVSMEEASITVDGCQ